MNTTETLEGLKRALATMDKALQTTRTAIAMSEKTIRSLTADSRQQTADHSLTTDQTKGE